MKRHIATTFRRATPSVLLPKELHFRTISLLLPKESENRITYFSCPQSVQSGFHCILFYSLLPKESYFRTISLLLPKELSKHRRIWHSVCYFRYRLTSISYVQNLATML